MQLDRLAVQLRLRNPWEAIDLGFAMVRTWARAVYAAWLVLFVPLCVLAMLALPGPWAVLLVWWLKPALDRMEDVVDLLNANRESLDAGVRLLAPFYRVFANTLGNGPWFDTIIQNLPPAPAVGGR